MVLVVCLRILPHPSHTKSRHPFLYLYNYSTRAEQITNLRVSGGPIDQNMASSTKQGHANRRVAVVGAGVSGLAAAYKLKLHGLNVTIFEAEGRAGGKLRSISQDGLIWDEGANTMTESEAEVSSLLDSLQLRGKQQFPILQNKRYIARNGTPVLIPSDPIALVRSNFLSAKSKLQILLEPFLWKKSNFSKVSDTQESVGGFFQRHFGKEVVEYLIDPFVAGVSAGDPESLSMRHAFPDIWNLEKRFGSIIIGAIRSKVSAKNGKGGGMKDSSANKKRQHGSFSFLGGMQTLTDALCEELGKDELNLQSKVLELSCTGIENSPLENCWHLEFWGLDMDSRFGESTDPSFSGDPSCEIVVFECNIYFELAQDPILSLCGHLYCWPCLYRWLHIDSYLHKCPVCEALIQDEKLVPIYGRGKTTSNLGSRSIPGVDIPSRPAGQRTETTPTPAINYFRRGVSTCGGIHANDNC